MLNIRLRKEAVKKLEIEIKRYNNVTKYVQTISERLFNLRNSVGDEVISPIENYLYSLSNRPQEFEKSISKLKIEFEKFEKHANQIKQEVMENNIKAGVGAATGTATAAGVTALMPTTAMAIATTFGTASTGAAISGLSGAAATNAALAWLGGGALVSGGGGMAAGNALLALAGPIGWGIAGVSLIGSGLFYGSNNKKIAEKANKQSLKVEKQRNELRQISIKIENLHDITLSHKEKIIEQLNYLKYNGPDDYGLFNDDLKNILGALINNTNSLSSLINKPVDTNH